MAGCLLASYITFDLSPELARQQPAGPQEVDGAVMEAVRSRVAAAGLTLEPGALGALVCSVWPAVEKMKRRDEKYRAARERAFTSPAAGGTCANSRSTSFRA